MGEAILVLKALIPIIILLNFITFGVVAYTMKTDSNLGGWLSVILAVVLFCVNSYLYLFAEPGFLFGLLLFCLMIAMLVISIVAILGIADEIANKRKKKV